MLSKVGEKRTVRKMKQSGRVVGHWIQFSSDMVEGGVVPEVTLVKTRKAEQVGRGVASGDGLAFRSGDRRGVVVQDADGAFTYVVVLCQDVLMGNNAG